jgi:HEAT repeat protein
VIELLKDKRADVRDGAVLFLQKIRATNSVPDLLELLEREQDQMVVWRAQLVLAELGAREVIPAFIKMLKGQNVSKISAALKMLGQLQASEALPHIIEFIRDSKIYSKEVGEAINVLGALGGRGEVAEFVSWLKAEDSPQRFFGIVILQTLKAKETGLAMLDLIKDEAADVRLRAIMTLGEWQIREAIPQIIEALEDTDREVIIQAVVALHIMKASEAVPNLLNRLYHFPYSKFNNLPQFDYLYQQLVLALEHLGDEAVREQIKAELAMVRDALEYEREKREAQARGDYF